MNLSELFAKHENEYVQFERIENPRHYRPDLCAFLMLADAVPGTGDMISSSEHDEFFLSVDCDELAKVATSEMVRDLVRCGVRYSEDYNCLCMFS